MRILVVEHDAALGHFLARSLRMDGHQVDWVGDGEAALVAAEASDVDLMVLDLLLPSLSGAEVLERMRNEHGSCSVITLTADQSTDARVNSLNNGADDCVAKPFSLQELIARCRAHLRRRSQLNKETLEHDGLILHRRARTVKRQGISIDLTAKEFMLLEFLLERKGRCSSRSELLQRVFQLPADSGTNVVEVYINYLRRKLAPSLLIDPPPVIQTVRGSGYRIMSASPTMGVSRADAHLMHAASV